MTVDTMLMISGVFVATLPFLGFPQSWDTVLFAIVGVLIVGLGIVVRRRGSSASHSPAPRSSDSYSIESAHRHEELAQ